MRDGSRKATTCPEYEEAVAEVVQLEDFVLVTFASDRPVKVFHETDKVEVWE